MATYGAGLKIAALVDVNAIQPTYTVGAGEYAILHWVVDNAGAPSGTATVTVNGHNALTYTNAAPYPQGPIHLGPGGTLKVDAGGSNVVQIFGILFSN